MLTVRPGTGPVVVPGAVHGVHLDQPGVWARLLRRRLDTGHDPLGSGSSRAPDVRAPGDRLLRTEAP